MARRNFSLDLFSHRDVDGTVHDLREADNDPPDCR